MTVKIAWAPGKRRLYEAQLETFQELDLDLGSCHAEELGEAVDNGFEDIASAPQTSVLRGQDFGFEYRGKLITFSLHARDKYFLWYTYEPQRNSVLVHSVGPVKPETFP